MSTLDEITNEKQRISEALTRVAAQREKLISQLSELEATERVLARHTKGVQPRKTASAKMPIMATEAAAPARPRGRRRTTTSKPAGGRRTPPTLDDRVPCSGNGQDAAANHRSVQGGSPEPRRRRHCPAQARRPHRRARREALRQIVDRATCSRPDPGIKSIGHDRCLSLACAGRERTSFKPLPPLFK